MAAGAPAVYKQYHNVDEGIKCNMSNFDRKLRSSVGCERNARRLGEEWSG